MKMWKKELTTNELKSVNEMIEMYPSEFTDDRLERLYEEAERVVDGWKPDPCYRDDGPPRVDIVFIDLIKRRVEHLDRCKGSKVMESMDEEFELRTGRIYVP